MTHKLSLVSKLLLLIVIAGAMVMACSKGDGEESDEGATQTVTKDHIPPGSNRLALEKSPYLLQHAQNPVDWYPWGEEAFEKARAEDKPIFLSIGYSTCHWCHVMEHESFEDSTVAALMNDAFVNIKVDREERPDIDNIYMQVCQIMTRSGGWPLTIVMTAERKPFFAATYIPKDARYGRAGLTTLIPEIKRVWVEDRPKILDASTQITDHLQNYIDGRQPGQELGKIQLELAYEQLASRFDDTHGGFGTAPKFPTPHNLLFLLRYWKRSGDPNALAMVESTLGNMADGGIYDHVGFGFHRYSTDARWFAPHFEKMLYDQALLIMAYTEAYLATGNSDYRRTAEEIIHYIERDMTDPLGGFYSAEDADSEGIEGKFYLWSQVQLREVLQADDAELVINLYGVTEHGNFAEEVNNANILFLNTPLSLFAAENSMSEQELRERLGSIRETLFAERQKRIAPYKDDKILTDWNGLMIAALAKAGRAFDEPEYTARAQRATDFVLTNMRDDDGELLHRYRQGSAGIESTVDDYAFFVWGLLELYESDFDVAHLEVALELNRELITHFWDDVKGGLYFTPDDGEQLIVRMKEVYDGAIPSGNSVAMLNFLRLARMTGDTELESKAAAIGRAFSKEVSPAPAQFALMMLGVDFGVGPSYEVIVVGDPDDQATQAMTRALNSEFIPNKVVLVKPTAGEPRLQEIAAYTAPHQALDGKPTVYVCRNYACELPTTDIEKMLEMLAVEREE